jgi:hypothetical protein
VADDTQCLAEHSLRAPIVRAIDPEGRLPAAIEALGPVSGRDVAVLDDADGPATRRLLALGAWVRAAPDGGLSGFADTSAHVLVAWRRGFCPDGPRWWQDLAEAARVLRADGRLLVIHDYDRDDVGQLLGGPDRARALIAWSRPRGPFLGIGFRVRVLHCWWRWDTLEEAATVLEGEFGAAGAAVAAGLHRPRLSHKLAVYHADASLLATITARVPAA